jgi:hypothetical protein
MSTIRIEDFIGDVLSMITGQQLSGDAVHTTKGPRFIGSIYLTDSLKYHGDAALFRDIPEQYILKYHQENFNKVAHELGVILLWDDSQWVFSMGQSWKDGKLVDNEQEVQRVLEGWSCWISKRQIKALLKKEVGFSDIKKLMYVLDNYLKTSNKMYKQLLELVEGPYNTGNLTSKGKGTIEFYIVPEKNVEEVKKLLNVELHESNWAYCENPATGYKSLVHVELFVPDKGDVTAQLYGLPYDCTDDPFLYLSEQVVLR